MTPNFQQQPAQPPEFLDADAFIPPQEINFRQIALRQLQKAGDALSREMHGGFTQEKIHYKAAYMIKEKVYIPDSLAEASDCVYVLADYIAPHYDEKMTKKEEEIVKLLDAVKDEDRGDKFKLIRKYFRTLNHFIKRKKYFEAVRLKE